MKATVEAPVKSPVEAHVKVIVHAPVNSSVRVPVKGPMEVHVKTQMKHASESIREIHMRTRMSKLMFSERSRENRKPSPPKALITQRVVLRYICKAGSLRDEGVLALWNSYH